MHDLTDPAPDSLRRWAIFAIASLNFIISMFYRMSTAVISPALVRDLGFTSGQLGDLSAAFYYAFAMCQIPVGMALDRLGSRITVGVLSVAAVGGAILFAVGQTPTHLILARGLLGIGMSCNFMVVLTLIAAWFPVNQFGFLSGLVVSIGILGNLLAATPLTLLNLAIGWRASFWLFAKFNLVVVLLFLLIVRDRPPGGTEISWKPRSLTSGLRHLVRMYSYWAISLTSFVRYGYVAALQSLWAVPFLIFGLGWGEVAASNAVLCLGIGNMVGLPLSGAISDRILRSRKKVVLPNMIAFCLLALAMAMATQSTASGLIFVCFFCLGLVSAPGQILYAHMKELVPPSMIAQAMTSVNLFTIIGVAIMTHVLGFAVGSDPSHLLAPVHFRSLWYIGGIGLAAVSFLYFFVPDSQALKPKDV